MSSPLDPSFLDLGRDSVQLSMGSWKFGPYWKVSEHTLRRSWLKINCIMNLGCYEQHLSGLHPMVSPVSWFRTHSVCSPAYQHIVNRRAFTVCAKLSALRAAYPFHCGKWQYCPTVIPQHLSAKLTYFWIILSWNVWFWKLTFGLLTWVILKKIQWICLGVSTEALKFLKWPYTHFWQFELCICAQQNSQHWWL